MDGIVCSFFFSLILMEKMHRCVALKALAFANFNEVYDEEKKCYMVPLILMEKMHEMCGSHHRCVALKALGFAISNEV